MLTHFGHVVKVLERIIHSLNISFMFFILSFQVEHINKEANKAKDVQSRKKKQYQKKKEKVYGFVQIFTDCEDKRVTYHHLHYWLTFLNKAIVARNNLVISLDECALLFFEVCLHLKHSSIHKGFAHLF